MSYLHICYEIKMNNVSVHKHDFKYLYNATAEISGFSLSFSRDIIERICICIVKCTNINKTLILQNVLYKNHYEDTTRII